MKDYVQSGNTVTPMLFPYEPDHFWQQIRLIVREEITRMEKGKPATSSTFETPGLTQKPLYKITELCDLFQVTKPTIYDWIKHGKLKPLKIRSRVFFLWQDVQQLLRA
jgi:excisionase family DNA binding protein